MPDPDVVIVDADTVAGWRRVTPSFEQLQAAVADLRAQAPGSTVAIVGDPALKWALSNDDQRLLDDEINHQRIVLAPAGTRGGHVGFISAAVRRGATEGTSVVVVTDRAIPGLPDRPAAPRGHPLRVRPGERGRDDRDAHHAGPPPAPAGDELTWRRVHP